MSRIAVVSAEDVHEEGRLGPGCRLDGRARAKVVSPSDYPLWLVTAAIEPGSTLEWGSDHGEQALYVRSGRLELDHGSCEPGGVLVVEGDATLVARVPVATEVVQVGNVDGSARGRAGSGHHLIGPEGLHGHTEGPHAFHFYADAQCPGCTLTLHWSSHTEWYESRVHSHSQDELIHVLRGEISVGRRRVGPGDTLAVAAHSRYRFESGEEGYAFLNYSPDKSEYIPAATG